MDKNYAKPLDYLNQISGIQKNYVETGAIINVSNLLTYLGENNLFIGNITNTDEWWI